MDWQYFTKEEDRLDTPKRIWQGDTNGLKAGDIVWGWALDKNAPDKPVDVIIRIGDAAFRAPACRIRADLVGKLSPSGCHGFEFKIPDEFIGSGATVKVFFGDGVTPLPRGAITLLAEKDPRAAGPSPGSHLNALIISSPGETPIYGRISDIDLPRIAGWVLAPAFDGQDVRLTVDGMAVAQKPLELVDVNEKYGRANFAFGVPAFYFDDGLHLIAVKLLRQGDNELTIGQFVAVLRAEAAPAFSLGSLQTSLGRLSGTVKSTTPYPLADLAVALLVDGFLTAVAEVEATERESSFSFPLDRLTLDLASLETVTIAIPDAPDVAPALCAPLLTPRIGAMTRDGALEGFRVVSPVRLSGDIRLDVTSESGESVAQIRTKVEVPDAEIILALDGTLSLQDSVHKLRFRLNGVEVDSTHPTECAATPSRERASWTAVEPTHRAVREAILTRGTAKAALGGSSGHRLVSGAWRFSPPNRVEGWAVELANPGRKVSVEIRIDGRAIRTMVASGKIVAGETGLTAPVDHGFAVDLDELPIPAGPRRLAVAVAGGPPLFPVKEVVFHGHGEPGCDRNDLSAVDPLVESGRIAEAFVALSGCALQSQEAARRFLATDFALRAEWFDYPQRLAEFASIVSADMLESLASAGQWLAHGAARESAPHAPPLDLPQSYGSLLRERIAAAASDTKDEVAVLERAALWRALTQIRESADHADVVQVVDGGKSRVVVLDLNPQEAACRLLGDDLDALICVRPDREDIDEIWSAEPYAALSRLHESLREMEADFVFVTTAARTVPAASARWWPHLFRLFGAGMVTVTRARSARAAGLPGLHGREFDASSSILPFDSLDGFRRAVSYLISRARTLDSPDDFSEEAFASAAEFVVSGPADDMSGDVTSPLLIYHDLGAQSLPALPRNSVVVHQDWTASGGFPSAADIANICASLDAGEAAATGVIILSSRFVYPADYLVDLAREFVRAGRRDLAIGELLYHAGRMAFAYALDSRRPECMAAVIAFGCFTVATLRKATTQSDAGGVRLLCAQTPFRIGNRATSRLGENIERAIALFRESTSEAEHQLGFESEAAKLAIVPLSRRAALLLNDADAVDAMLKGLSRNVYSSALADALITVGCADLIPGLMESLLAQPGTLVALPEAELQKLIVICRSIGNEQAFVEAILSVAPEFFNKNKNSVIPFFECAATVLSPDDLAALLLTALACIVKDQQARFLFRIVEVAKRYCSPGVTIAILSLIDSSGHAELLRNPEIQRHIADALLIRSSRRFRLLNTNLRDVDFAANPSPEIAVVQSILAGDRSRFLRSINAFLGEGRGEDALAKLIRTYTHELREFQIQSDEVWYRTSSASDQARRLAVILDHADSMGALVSEQFSATGDSIAIAWRSRRNDYRPLNLALSRWLTAEGAAPIELAGGDAAELFRSCYADRGFPPATDHGLASVVMTVFNPDLSLLKIAVESIIAQSYRNLELILVDDCSDLVDPAEIERVAGLDQRIRFIRSPKNAGPYHCRNLALAIARGVFVAIHDGDDVAHPQRLQAQIETLVASDTRQLCTTCHLRIDHDGTVQFEHTLDILGDGTMTSVYRRSALDRLNGFAAVRSRGDVEIRERIRACFGGHALRHLNAPFMYCYATPNSLSNATATLYPEFLALLRDNISRRILYPIHAADVERRTPRFPTIPHVLRSITPR